ncbi:TlpA family protein disulfide reductase [Allomuricauda sp. CAU 1633]|uniref:TlpA family protein disulfide reductase n=1 Tax=Allomuricauda sp. CAU 1633 TaxID=2816036 RepID=UPI001F5D3E4E|nr:redoxin domain-containing protein [Muricauda sp. CAU 1633]
MVRFLLGLTLLSTFGCAKKNGECASVFFGGEIVNPTNDYVVLYRNDAYIDSVRLDDNNRFSFNLQGIDEGLYHFDHAPELQYIYLQEGDSLLARLNTVEFDESLVFSGTGSEVNNFLVEMFLAYENEEPQIYEYYPLDPEAFSQKIDSLRAIKINHLNDLVVDNQLSERALNMAKATIDYNSYITKEKYPFYHKRKTGEETIHDLDESFYDYRKNIDFNNRDLTYFRPYFDFMKWHFGNISYMSCLKDCGGDHEAVNDRLHFNKHKLYLVDSLVAETEIRDILFRNIAVDYLLKEHNPSQECQLFIDKFNKLSSNEQHKEEIDHLYKGIRHLQPNQSLPNFILKDINNQNISLKEIVGRKKNTVFYFWTASQQKPFRSNMQHVEKLKKKYPDHNFVGINLKTSYPQWQLLVEEYKLDKNTQFHGENFKEIQMAMIIDKLNKCIITKDTVIVDAFADLYTSL